MKFDIERLGKIFSDLDRYFADMNELHIKTPEDLKTKTNFYSVSMILLSSINRILDLGEEIIETKNIGFPSRYKDIFWLLSKAKIIDTKFQTELSKLVDDRNVLSHEYFVIREKDVFKMISKISLMKKFVKIMKNLVNKEIGK